MQNESNKISHLEETIIPRKFRFTLESFNHPEITNWVVSIDLDLKKKELFIKVIENQNLNVSKWIEDLSESVKSKNSSKDILTINNIDGKGKVICKTVFKKLKCLKHICPYNYKNSEAVTHEVTVSFGYSEFYPKNECQNTK